MALKLNSKQKKNFALISEYLTTDDIGSGGSILDDNEVTSLWAIDKIYKNASGVESYSPSRLRTVTTSFVMTSRRFTKGKCNGSKN